MLKDQTIAVVSPSCYNLVSDDGYISQRELVQVPWPVGCESAVFTTTFTISQYCSIAFVCGDFSLLTALKWVLLSLVVGLSRMFTPPWCQVRQAVGKARSSMQGRDEQHLYFSRPMLP